MIGTKPTGHHKEKRLTAVAIRSLKEPGFYADGHGLYLKVDASGAKRWVQRIVIHGKRRDIGLGSASLVTLAEAREIALRQRRQARAGDDPLALKHASMRIPTFEETAVRVHDLSSPTWRNEKHGQQWLHTLQTYVYSFFGSKKIDQITGTDVLAALTPIWNTKPETARRVKQRIGTVMKYAMAQGWRVDNPADAITKALPTHDRSLVNHHKSLPYEQVAAALDRVKASDAGTVTKLAIEFLVLTATRSGETRKATWDEIDINKKVWTIPGTRMKAKKLHRVPLSPRCLKILEEAKPWLRDDQFIFPGAKNGLPLSDMTFSKLLKELRIAAVPHGFRSSFRVWAGDITHHPREVIEFAMAHVIQDKAEAAYARSDLFEKRKTLMNDWACYLGY